MKELLRNDNPKDKTPVSARALYDYLGYNTSQWKRWYTKNIINNKFAIENEDYVGFVIETNGNQFEVSDTMSKTHNAGGRPTMDFAITIDFAKKLSMQSQNEKGEEARNYFIACENRLKEITQKPLSQIDLIIQSALQLKEQEQRLSAVETKVDVLMQIREEAEAELKALPVATESVPELPLRDKIRMLVNRYCSATGLFQKEVWDNVYQTLYYNYHIAIKGYAKNKTESWIDVAERKGFLDKIYTIVSGMLRSKGLVA